MAERIPLKVRGDVPECVGCGVRRGRPGDRPFTCWSCRYRTPEEQAEARRALEAARRG